MPTRPHGACRNFAGKTARAAPGCGSRVSNDGGLFPILDPSRSAEAAQKLFAESLLDTVIVCDRYSAYKRLRSPSPRAR